ncbi:DUF4190 domain-containing protein [Demequina flava]|uniref:DUF4190 domain-containing protein n=1 Tax=Demequina flava TaxID=1095025 RepID=UPI000783F8C3|nr:DUF4190 domain-containing protein [Demequina flava]
MSTPPNDPFERKSDGTGPDASQQPPASAPQAPQAPEPPVYGAPPAGGYAPQPQYAQPPAQYGQQPPYAQQPQYAQPGGKMPGTEKNWMNITSLACSLGGLIIGISVIPGIIFGHMGRAAAKRGEANNGGLGLAGLIVGYALVVLSIIAIVAFTMFFGWLASECGGSSPAEWCESDSGVTIEALA